MHKRKRSKEAEDFKDSSKSLKKNLDNESLISLMSNLYLSENSYSENVSEEIELPYQPTRTLPSYFYKKESKEESEEGEEESEEESEEGEEESEEENEEGERDLDSLIGEIPDITEFYQIDIETIYDSDTDTEKSIESSLTPFFVDTTDEEDSEKDDIEIPIKFSKLKIK
jgi:hypothetical protein